MKTKELRRAQGLLAARISEARKEYRQEQREGRYPPSWSLLRDIALFRHKHIGYSLARGRSYEEIEKPRQDHKPDAKEVEKYRQEYLEAVLQDRKAYEEALCVRQE